MTEANNYHFHSQTLLKLVIAEKPSVARSIAAALGATQKQKGYLEGNGYLVSWCIGHLVELAPPIVYDEKFAKWRKEDLPILPEPWQYTVCEATKVQFGILKRLMDDSCVSSLICATDAGREGELIFRLVYASCGCKKPVARLWISSMEESAIREGFQNLKPSTAYDPLYKAALCRAQADWLVGINATRLFSTMYGKLLNIGRVMSPTLSMLVNRQAQIAAFEPTPFYHVQLECGGFTVQCERLKNHAEAERIAALCKGQDAKIIALESKEKSDNPPKLYDLTSLQRDANRLLGYTAQQTLDYAQSLYEKKLCTYPRTDSRYLTEHMEASTRELVQTVYGVLPFSISGTLSCNASRVIDSAKVADHHDILPTGSVLGVDLPSFPAGERNILTLLMARLLCAVDAPSRIDETTATVECEGITFTTKGSIALEHGWCAIDTALHTFLGNKNDEAKSQDKALPKLERGMIFASVTPSIKEGQTSPPKHFTEDTLLSAMENAGDSDMPEDAERKGLGTPATRAGIIEKLVKTGLVERKGAKKAISLIPTKKGASLITILPEELQSPALTGEWEHHLRQIERGEMEPEAFMRDIHSMVCDLVNTSQPIKDAQVLFPDDRKSIGVCPRCGSQVVESHKGFLCTNHDCRFALWKNNQFFTSKKKELTATMATALLQEGCVFIKGLYSQKTGKTYDAMVTLDDTGERFVKFKLEFPAQK